MRRLRHLFQPGQAVLCRHYASSIENSQHLNKNSRLKACIWSIEVITGTTESSELKRRRSTRSKSGSSTEPTTPPPIREYDTSAEIGGLSTNQTKYMDKIRRKLSAGSSAPLENEAMLSNMSTSKGGIYNRMNYAKKQGDAAILASGLKMTKDVNRDNEDNQSKTGAASSWLLAEGMGALLDYISSRSIKNALVPTFQSTDKLMDDFLGQSDFSFSHIESSYDEGLRKAKTSKVKYAASRLKRLLTDHHEFKHFSPHEIMLVSSDSQLLAAAREMQLITCKYRVPNALYGSGFVHYTAKSSLEVQDAIEDLNGIALRRSSFQSRN